MKIYEELQNRRDDLHEMLHTVTIFQREIRMYIGVAGEDGLRFKVGIMPCDLSLLVESDSFYAEIIPFRRRVGYLIMDLKHKGNVVQNFIEEHESFYKLIKYLKENYTL